MTVSTLDFRVEGEFEVYRHLQKTFTFTAPKWPF
jgi:hypothetical protein